ncbi:transposase zinc-binding domain-containing protein [Piscinibacter sp. XHJ-5]|uniref:transposase zinc-binding domain-containing protein n=1 Tax=Piscinibacter sp. XHJ-5 TaxID=3037797 RepID=UPI002452EF1D|nr:transposase zinc-binding domain-containing protein [Piscinibacter sp. XHJ-5]
MDESIIAAPVTMVASAGTAAPRVSRTMSPGTTSVAGKPIRPEQTTLYRLVQQHAASFIAHTEASTRSELPRFIKVEFDAFLECGILAHGFLRLRCGECGHDKLLAFSCKRRGFCPIVRGPRAMSAALESGRCRREFPAA